jgi:hypothetical protein
MPHVVEVADRIQFHRLGRRIAVVTPKTHTMNEVVATMTGAAEPGAVGYDQVVKDAERADPRRSAEASRRRSRTAETAAGGPSSPSRCRPPDSASAEVPGAGRSSRTGGPRRSCGP